MHIPKCGWVVPLSLSLSLYGNPRDPTERWRAVGVRWRRGIALPTSKVVDRVGHHSEPCKHSRADEVRRATLTERNTTRYSSSRGPGARDCGHAPRGMIDRGSCELGSPASAPRVPATGSDASRQRGHARFPATSAGVRPSGPMERARVGRPACRVPRRGQRGRGRGAGRLPTTGREERS